MKSISFSLFVTCTLSLLLPVQSSAIVVRGDALADSVLVDPNDYPEVVALLDGRAVGTLIHDEWIITAAHVGQIIDNTPDGKQLSIGGEPYVIARVVLHPSWNDEAVGAPGVFDIALLRLTRAVSGVLPVPVYQGREELNAVVTLFGWGRTGDGETERLVRDGRFRLGENRIDAVSPRLQFRFDEPASIRSLPLEAVSGPGDSGGPAFIEADGIYYLAGISSFQEDEVVPGIFGVTENYERVSDHATWIEQVIGR